MPCIQVNHAKSVLLFHTQRGDDSLPSSKVPPLHCECNGTLQRHAKRSGLHTPLTPELMLSVNSGLLQLIH